MNEYAIDAMIYAWLIMKEKEENSMEGIYVGKVTRSKVDKNSADLLFIDHRQDIHHLNDIIEFDDTAYCLVPSNDIIINNDELLKLRDEVKRLTDECNEWKVRYSTVNNKLFQKGLAYGTLEGAYKNEKIAGEMLLKDHDALKEQVAKLEAELTEIKTTRTLREAYIAGVEQAAEDLADLRDKWKRRFNSVVTDFAKTLSANGIEFTLKEIHGDGNWDVVIDIPELNEAKKKVEDLEKKLKAAKSNETFWRDRKEEEEDYHHYWLHTFDRAVKQAAEKGIHIDVRTVDEDCNAGVVVIDNVKAKELEKQVVALEKTNKNLDQKIGACDNALEYWNNTYNDIVIAGKNVGVKIDIKGKKPDMNAGFVYVTNEKAKYLEKAFDGVRSERDSLDIQNGSLKEVICRLKNGAKRLEKDNDTKAKAVVEAMDRGDHWKHMYDDLAEYWDNTRKDLVARGKTVGVKIEFKDDASDGNVGYFDITNEKTIELMVKVSDTKHEYNKKWQAMLDALKAKGVEVIYMGEEDEKPCVDVKVPEIDILKKELEALKSRTLDNVEIRLSCGDIVWTYCDGFVHVSSGISGIISADEIATGTVPKCSSCAHYMHNPSRFAHDWCYMPVPKEGGAGYIRKLSKEEAEGPACADFKVKE